MLISTPLLIPQLLLPDHSLPSIGIIYLILCISTLDLQTCHNQYCCNPSAGILSYFWEKTLHTVKVAAGCKKSTWEHSHLKDALWICKQVNIRLCQRHKRLKGKQQEHKGQQVGSEIESVCTSVQLSVDTTTVQLCIESDIILLIRRALDNEDAQVADPLRGWEGGHLIAAPIGRELASMPNEHGTLDWCSEEPLDDGEATNLKIQGNT
ncbi:hypothetical protein BDR06DRAFT_966974 [Suillus hirtellus]|nr:hypothetical protein BDR06DRAFT_966974 [Suillus hirtellus]